MGGLGSANVGETIWKTANALGLKCIIEYQGARNKKGKFGGWPFVGGRLEPEPFVSPSLNPTLWSYA